MYPIALLLLSLFFLPIFSAENAHQTDMYIPRSMAARYLFGSSNRLGNAASIDGVIDQDQTQQQQQQRAKRIYWENLAFHASDFNRKTKKFGRFMF